MEGWVKPHLRITSASLLMVPPSVKGLSQPSNSLPMGLQHNVDLYSTPGPEGANLRVKEDSSLGKRTSVSSSLLYEASPSLLKVTRIVAEPTRPTTRKAPTSPLKQLHQQEQCACPVTANLERPLHPHCEKYLSPFRCLPHPIWIGLQMGDMNWAPFYKRTLHCKISTMPVFMILQLTHGYQY